MNTTSANVFWLEPRNACLLEGRLPSGSWKGWAGLGLLFALGVMAPAAAAWAGFRAAYSLYTLREAGKVTPSSSAQVERDAQTYVGPGGQAAFRDAYDVTYTYEVAGKSYHGEGRLAFNAYQTFLATGALNVRYDPERPDISTPNLDIDQQLGDRLGSAAFMSLIAAFFALICVWLTHDLHQRRRLLLEGRLVQGSILGYTNVRPIRGNRFEGWLQVRWTPPGSETPRADRFRFTRPERPEPELERNQTVFLRCLGQEFLAL